MMLTAQRLARLADWHSMVQRGGTNLDDGRHGTMWSEPNLFTPALMLTAQRLAQYDQQAGTGPTSTL